MSAIPAEPIGVAVIGCGSTAHRRHLPLWSSMTGARLSAVCSRNPERRRLAREQYGADRDVADWRELIGARDVDAVDICAPHPQHAEMACAFLRAGQHVLCEKPIAVRLSDAEAMVEAAAAGGAVLMPFHNMRLAGVPSQAISVVRAGRVGRPALIRAVMAHGGPDARDPARRWFLEAGAGGGALLDLGPHVLDLIGAIMPEPPMRLRATLRRVADLAVERDALVELEYPGGSLAHVIASWSLTGGRETTLTIQGQSGLLRMCLLQTPSPTNGATPAPLVLSTPDAGEEYPEPGPNDEPCAAFLRAIRGEAAAVTAAEGLQTVRWIDAAYRSDAMMGAWVDL